MSYSIYLNAPAVAPAPCATCGRSGGGGEPEGLDPTYNLAAIFIAAVTPELAGVEGAKAYGVRALHGRTGRDTVELLKAACARINDPARRGEFQALEPENGWGDLDGARRVLQKMLENAHQYPDNVWHVC